MESDRAKYTLANCCDNRLSLEETRHQEADITYQLVLEASISSFSVL